MDTKITYKLKISCILRSFKFDAIILIILYLFLFYKNFDSDLLVGVLIGYIVTAILGYYLFFEFLIYNLGQEVIIKKDCIYVVRKLSQKSIRYNFKDIQKTYLVRSKSIERNGIQFSSMEGYFFYKIIFNDGESIYLTNLVLDSIYGLDDSILKLGLIKHVGVFNSILADKFFYKRA